MEELWRRFTYAGALMRERREDSMPAEIIVKMEIVSSVSAGEVVIEDAKIVEVDVIAGESFLSAEGSSGGGGYRRRGCVRGTIFSP